MTTIIERIRAALERVPYAVLALPLRFAIATIFWNSAMTKLANWEAALSLFTEEYRVPVLPPEIAAYMAVSIELAAPVLMVLGLFTRGAAFVLLGMTAVIEIFVYPQAWPTHIQWVAMLLVLLCRGGRVVGGCGAVEQAREPVLHQSRSVDGPAWVVRGGTRGAVKWLCRDESLTAMERDRGPLELQAELVEEE